MPPWKPEPGYGEFVGSRRLTDEQIAAIARWADNGAPLGDPAVLPAPPPWSDGWQLGPPDVIVKMPQAYRLPPDGSDRLRNFIVPIQIPARRYVKAWEFRTNNSRVVHHATMMIDQTRASQQRDQDDPEPGYEGLIPLSAKNPDGYFLGWTPGQTPSVVQSRMAWPLDRDSDLVMMLHLRPTGAWETIEASVGLYFSASAATQTPAMIRLNRQDIDIPPGDPHYSVSDSYVLPVAVDVYSVQPHAHNLAKEMKAWATMPDGRTMWLMYIRDWDFHCQDSYRYAAPVRLPSGTRLQMEYTYDNSRSNPVNPNRPPKRVTWGQRTSNEMGDLWIQVLPVKSVDLPVLNRSLREKLLPQDIMGYQMMLAADPDNVGLHDDLALLFAEAGDLQSAVGQFADSVRLKPNAPAAHYNLGKALLALREWNEADAHFHRALELNPTYAFAHYGIALSLAARGQPDAAVQQLREAIRLAPDFGEAYYNLGVLLQMKSELAEALAAYSRAADIGPAYADAHFAVGLVLVAQHRPMTAIASFRHALELRGEWPAAQVQLAWILATAPDPSARNANEALLLAERAVQLTRQPDTRTLDVLAASLAANGEFDRAVAAAENALAALAPDGALTEATGIRRRLELYRQRKPYVEDR
jgi:tetratricopeptide (TPR) repeat protein